VFIRAARFVAFVFVVELLAKFTVLLPELNLHDPEVELLAVRTSVFPRPVIVSVAPLVGSAEKVPVALAATPAEVMASLQSFVMGSFPVRAGRCWGRTRPLWAIWKRGSLTILYHLSTVPFRMASASVPGLE
jgi:hypothetical protein